MKLRNEILILFGLGLSLGCIKTGTKEIILPDQEIKGNQGYLKGSPPQLEKPLLPRKKKILSIEIELPTPERKVPSPDKEIWGNQGSLYRKEEKMKYVYLEPAQPKKEEKPAEVEVREEPEFLQPAEPVPEVAEKLIPSPQEVPPEEKAPKEEKYIEYKVKEGENLWSIAKKIYGEGTKWTLIYEQNRDLLKSPDEIKPGMVLKIPISGEMEFIK